MQELLQIIVKRIRAIEDAYHEGTQALEQVGRRLDAIDTREHAAEAPSEDLIRRLDALEQRIAASERAAGDVPSLTARTFVLEERLGSIVQRLESQTDHGTRVEELAEVVAGLHAAQQALRDTIDETPFGQKLEILEERLSGLEAALGDATQMADHVIAHEAQLTTIEHHTGDLGARLGAIEEQAAAYQSQFGIFDRQLGAHRNEMNAFEERAAAIAQRQDELHEDAIAGPARMLHDRVDALEETLADLGEPYRALEEKFAETRRALEARFDETGERFATADARFASLGERIAAVQDLYKDVVRQAQEIASINDRLQEIPGGDLQNILDRLAGLDRLAADVASHAGELATLRDRPAGAAPSPIVVAGEHAPEVRAQLDELARQVEDLRGNATMLDSIRTLLAASDVEKTFEDINERIAKLDAQIATLFTLQRMTAESENKTPVLSLGDD